VPSGFAIDSAADEIRKQARVAYRLHAPVDEQSREQRIIEKSVALRRLDRLARFVFSETAAAEARPELGLGEPAPGKKAQCSEACGHSSSGAPAATATAAWPLLETAVRNASRIFSEISSARSVCSSR